ncbi:ABC transporter ATP-binding protein [Oryzicola mucosus]|uniref:ABC transporter ATP-binding protein n=1 Tax=Oryzicola mucosus TaxID=2767425 RepID=A0A8J6PUB7_9HYPH|nr:ABC transporter ATP-binding protein [Oryzicola mucosus]MBD0413897.1 ABC transporter ATP-binding protein [Oryzicola mucosus]
MSKDALSATPTEAAGSNTVFARFDRVGKIFKLPGDRQIDALEDVSFTLGRGKLVGLLGPSGCGKTTFLRIVAGLETATYGTVTIEGKLVNGPHPNFAFVFQQANLMNWRTVLKNVLFPLEIRGEVTRASIERARDLLNLVGLHGFEDRYPSELSGGMQQRVALCRALVYDAKLLLMDEPFGALDELKRMEMHDLLLDIRLRTGVSVMFVTHSISEAIYLSDTVAVFSKRPATIARFIDIDFPYPRENAMRYEMKFTEYEHEAGRALGIAR